MLIAKVLQGSSTSNWHLARERKSETTQCINHHILACCEYVSVFFFLFFRAIHDISSELNCLKNGYLKKAIWHQKVQALTKKQSDSEVINFFSLREVSAENDIFVIVLFTGQRRNSNQLNHATSWGVNLKKGLQLYYTEVIKKCRIFMAIHGDYGWKRLPIFSSSAAAKEAVKMIKWQISPSLTHFLLFPAEFCHCSGHYY